MWVLSDSEKRNEWVLESRMEKGSSSSSSSSPGGPYSLKFGHKIYFEAGHHSKPPPPEAAAPPSPAKKGRTGLLQGGQPPRCQVEGCKLDLTDAKAYYSRHKVCAMHSKSPKVIVAGLEQRFCQQCSRFHQLPEFDQGKRSCRRRLAGHNERRRKPPPGSLLSPCYGSLCPTVFGNHGKTGGYLMDFSSYPTVTRRDPWPDTSERGLGNQTTGKYQLPWQSNTQNPLSDLLQGGVPRPSYSGPGGVSSADCFNGVVDSSSNALSLLSNQRWVSKTRSSSLGVNGFLGSSSTAMVQPPSSNPSATIGQFVCPSWDFKDNLHEMPPDLGLGQSSHPTNSHYTGELGLAQPNEGQFDQLDHHSRGYDSSVQHLNWSL